LIFPAWGTFYGGQIVLSTWKNTKKAVKLWIWTYGKYKNNYINTNFLLTEREVCTEKYRTEV
jgi:hypothetical protein